MALTIASANLNDDSFLEAFTACELPLSSFRHGDHLRLAWLHLHRSPFPAAVDRVRQDIRRFASFHCIPQLYHETVTQAWMRLLATHQELTFADFLELNESRLTPSLLNRFWSAGRLNSEAARHEWVPPDREPLPCYRLPVRAL